MRWGWSRVRRRSRPVGRPRSRREPGECGGQREQSRPGAAGDDDHDQDAQRGLDQYVPERVDAVVRVVDPAGIDQGLGEQDRAGQGDADRLSPPSVVRPDTADAEDHSGEDPEAHPEQRGGCPQYRPVVALDDRRRGVVAGDRDDERDGGADGRAYPAGPDPEAEGERGDRPDRTGVAQVGEGEGDELDPDEVEDAEQQSAEYGGERDAAAVGVVSHEIGAYSVCIDGPRLPCRWGTIAPKDARDEGVSAPRRTPRAC